jgi:hypothetical protein
LISTGEPMHALAISLAVWSSVARPRRLTRATRAARSLARSSVNDAARRVAQLERKRDGGNDGGDPDRLDAQIAAAHEDVARAIGRKEVLAEASAAVEADPFRRVLPDHHKLRDVKTCDHCGFMYGWYLKNRDANPGDNMGFKSMLEVCCGNGKDGCPGRFHGNRIIRKTSWTKIETIQAFDECEKLCIQITRLVDAEEAAQARAVAAVGGPLDAESMRKVVDAGRLLRDASGLRDDALQWLDEARRDRAGVIQFNDRHRAAYDDVIADARARPDDPMGRYATRQGIYRQAEIAAHNAVQDELYPGYVGEREVGIDDCVVFTASVWRDNVWAIQRRISDALQDVAYMLKRLKTSNKYRFSNAKTRLLVGLQGEAHRRAARRPAPEAEGAPRRRARQRQA